MSWRTRGIPAFPTVMEQLSENTTYQQSARLFPLEGNAYDQKSNQVNTEGTVAKEKLQKNPNIELLISITGF